MSFKRKGLNFTLFTSYFLSITVLMFVAVQFISFKLHSNYNEILELIESSNVTRKSSEIIKENSNKLSEKAEFFIMTHNKIYAESYINQKFHNDDIKAALNDLYKASGISNIYKNRLEIAMSQSNSLSEIELYAIRLGYEAAGIDKLPPEIALIEIRPSDKAQTKEAKQKIAQNVLFNEGYVIYKNRVSTNCDLIILDIKNSVQNNLEQKAHRLRIILNITLTLQGVLVTFFVIFFIMFIFQILNPLKEYSNSIQEEEHLTVAGAKELRQLAETYNNVHDYDELTKIYNRRGLEAACKTAEKKKSPVGFMFVDLDDFKQVNDNYGHSAGDFILEKLAALLSEHFSKDGNAVARIGGDEFAVLLLNKEMSDADSIKEEINAINRQLDELDEIKKVSISAGMAFSRNGYSKELYRNADKALYSVKYGSKHGSAVYDTVL